MCSFNAFAYTNFMFSSIYSSYKVENTTLLTTKTPNRSPNSISMKKCEKREILT